MTRALVVIDVQESFRQRPIWEAGSTPDIVAKANRLVEHSRRQGDLVVWVLHSAPGSGSVFDPALGYVRFLDGLAYRDGEPLLTKISINAFTTTDLQSLLQSHSIDEVVICGILTEQCCETTARLAKDLGFTVTFVTEATATFPIPHRDSPAGATVAEILADPRTLTNEQIIARTEYVLAGRFATIATIDELVTSAHAVMA
jgi:nicotinamidase-related amidase